jgi:prevent-host-death family protein
MTVHIDIAEAQQRFLEIIQAAARGEAVVITQDAQPIAQVTAAKEVAKRPQFGSARGLVTLTEAFDAPLDDFREYIP